MNRRMLFSLAAATLILAGCTSQMGSDFSDRASSLASVSASSSGSAYTPIESRSFEGSGNDVVSLGDLTDPAVLTFRCPQCTDNTSVKTDGGEGLIINTIGEYTGSHFINLQDNSMTTQVVISAHGSWSMNLEDVTSAPDVTSGSGDTAIILQEDATKATITNRGQSNFVVWVYSADGTNDLAVNEIGSYRGTVPFDAPALVQIESDGSWNIDLS